MVLCESGSVHALIDFTVAVEAYRLYSGGGSGGGGGDYYASAGDVLLGGSRWGLHARLTPQMVLPGRGVWGSGTCTVGIGGY